MTYTEAVKEIATMAQFGQELGLGFEEAIDKAVEAARHNSVQAQHRQGPWRWEIPTERLDWVFFVGVVAKDVADGNISRPSVGNVREAVRACMRGAK